jgi:hypothetical protein
LARTVASRPAAAVPVRVDARYRRQQRLGVGVLRCREDLGARPLLDDHALVHDGNPVGERAHHRKVMRDEDVGQAQVALQAAEQVEDLRLHGHVQGGDGFVADH